MPNCLVCDEKNSARHYGSICCSGCKGFFRRSVRFKRQYVCAYEKKCVIRREYRNCCRACRYQKCIDIGLDPMMVHSDRSIDGGKDLPSSSTNDPELPISSSDLQQQFGGFMAPSTSSSALVVEPMPIVTKIEVVTKEQWEEELRMEHQQNLTVALRVFLISGVFGNGSFWGERQMFCFGVMKTNLAQRKNFYEQRVGLSNDNAPLGTKGIIRAFNKRDYGSVKRYYTLVERLLDDFREHEYNHLITGPPLHNFNLNVSLEKAFLTEPRCVSDRSLMDWKPKVMIQPAWFARCWSRILVYYVDWVSHIPELAELDEHERKHLTIGRLAPCVWNIIANRSTFYHSDGRKRILLSGGAYFPMDEEQTSLDPNLSKFLNETCQWVWSEVVEPAIQMNVSEEEFALLRTICFLTPVPMLSRKAKAVIRNAQNYYRSVLTELVVNCSSTTDFLVLSKRLSSILMLLTPLEKTAQIEDENMAVMTMFDINQMNGQLPYEFYVRRTLRF